MAFSGRVVLLVLILSATPSCNDADSGGPTSPVTTTTAPAATTSTIPEPSRAQVTMQIGGIDLARSPVRGQRLRLTWDIVLTETAGVAARVNFVRQEIWNRDFDQYERSEIGVDQIPEVCGTNVLEGGSQWRCLVPFDINLTNFEGFLRLTVSLFDDYDNLIVLVVNVPFFEPK